MKSPNREPSQVEQTGFLLAHLEYELAQLLADVQAKRAQVDALLGKPILSQRFIRIAHNFLRKNTTADGIQLFVTQGSVKMDFYYEGLPDESFRREAGFIFRRAVRLEKLQNCKIYIARLPNGGVSVDVEGAA